MTLQPPVKRRPQAVPREAQVEKVRPPDAESPQHVTLTRAQAAASEAERRRRRRLKQASDDKLRPPTATPRGMPVRIYVSTRWISLLIVVALIIVTYIFFSRDIFYIHEIYVGGTHYLTPAQIFQRSNLANTQIFWVDPAGVEARLEQDPAIANAHVEVGWPPNMVQITITEREPALVWDQSGTRVWVDVRGRVMAQRMDLANLVRVVVEKPSKTVHVGQCPLMGMDEVLGPGSCIDPDIVAGALQFKALYPDVTEIVYDPAKGLGFHDGRGWLLWFGDGTDIVTKMAVYNKMVDSVYSAEHKTPVEFDVSDPDAPYYSASPATN